jgi:hypothetical protein
MKIKTFLYFLFALILPNLRENVSEIRKNELYFALDKYFIVFKRDLWFECFM